MGTESDIQWCLKGRNKPLELGQVGVRCAFCKRLPPQEKQRASTYFPGNLKIVYGQASSIAKTHLLTTCESVPEAVRKEIRYERDESSTRNSPCGKTYWAYA